MAINGTMAAYNDNTCRPKLHSPSPSQTMKGETQLMSVCEAGMPGLRQAGEAGSASALSDRVHFFFGGKLVE